MYKYILELVSNGGLELCFCINRIFFCIHIESVAEDVTHALIVKPGASGADPEEIREDLAQSRK